MKRFGYFEGAILLMFVSSCVCQNLDVQLDVGTIAGFYTKINITDAYNGETVRLSVLKYLGIPYAKPPVGESRFRKPEALTSLPTNPFNATDFGPYCPQGLDIFKPATGYEDEDCLTLNVYVPAIKPDKPSGRAVIVYIHGGSFIMGMSSMFDGTYLAAYGNVVVVTINYRLAMFGFLSTMDSSAPGNYGLFDQALALQWVQDNIASFGGDPDRVTLFGQSAGAMGVILQGLYPGNRQKVHRLIASSGTATASYLRMSRDTMSATKKIAASLECDRSETNEIIECLRSVPWQTLYNNTASMIYELLSQVPRVDGDFVKTDPVNLWKDFKVQTKTLDSVEFFQSLDLLTGVNYNEGGTFLTLMTGSDNLERFLPTNQQFLTSLIPAATQFVYNEIYQEKVNMVVLHEYTDWGDPFRPQATRLQYTKLLGDIVFVAPGIETARIHRGKPTSGSSGNGKTFVYQFLPKPTHSIVHGPSWLPGSNHGDELNFVFGAINQLPEAWEKELSLVMMSYLTSFVKTGQPSTRNPQQMEWPQYLADEAFIVFDNDNGSGTTGNYLGARETNFWRAMVPRLATNNVTVVTPATCEGHTSRGWGLLVTTAICLLGRKLFV